MLQLLFIPLLLAGSCIDLDHDTVCAPLDCDDTDPDIFYWQDFYLDEDHDGFGTGEVLESFCWGVKGYYIYPRDERSFNNLDCHDLDPEINPGQREICGNLIDEDCDGSICHHLSHFQVHKTS